jgi:glyoxylase-like metal-dependent hydrolase (beta-lactamase superfamily II)
MPPPAKTSWEEHMPYTITPLLTGVRTPDQGIMTYQQGYGTRIWLPVWAFLLQDGERNILVDTGLDEDELLVPGEFVDETGLTPGSLAKLLEEKGLAPHDIHMVVNTHLHDDHCGNNHLFPEARFVVHADELEFCRNPHPLDHRFDDMFITDCEFETVTEETEAAPGVVLIPAPGHTPGTMAVKVDTHHGPAVITGFCCNAKNFPANGPAVCPGVHTDALAAYDSIQMIKELGCRVIPMHELGLGRGEQRG